MAQPRRSSSRLCDLSRGEVRVYTVDTGDRDTVRLATRRILAGLLDISPIEVTFEYGPKGKPVLHSALHTIIQTGVHDALPKQWNDDASIHFSIAHAQAVSLIAVTAVAPVGVDIERVRAVPHAEMILRRFFSTEDVAAILSDDRRDLSFVRAWTRAEATVKVRGASLWEAATPDPSVRVRDVSAPEGYAASVAVAHPDWYLTQYPFDHET